MKIGLETNRSQPAASDRSLSSTLSLAEHSIIFWAGFFYFIFLQASGPLRIGLKIKTQTQFYSYSKRKVWNLSKQFLKGFIFKVIICYFLFTCLCQGTSNRSYLDLRLSLVLAVHLLLHGQSISLGAARKFFICLASGPSNCKCHHPPTESWRSRIRSSQTLASPE